MHLIKAKNLLKRIIGISLKILKIKIQIKIIKAQIPIIKDSLKEILESVSYTSILSKSSELIIPEKSLNDFKK